VTGLPDAAALSPRARWLEGSFIGRANTVDGVLPDGAVINGLVVRVRPDGALSLRALPLDQRAVVCGKVRPDPAVEACVASVLRQQEQRVRDGRRVPSFDIERANASERRLAPAAMSRAFAYAWGLVVGAATSLSS
jgi:hypothetical protein